MVITNLLLLEFSGILTAAFKMYVVFILACCQLRLSVVARKNAIAYDVL